MGEARGTPPRRLGAHPFRKIERSNPCRVSAPKGLGGRPGPPRPCESLPDDMTGETTKDSAGNDFLQRLESHQKNSFSRSAGFGLTRVRHQS